MSGPSETITVLFTCKQCGLTDREVKVPVRPANMNVVHWMEQIVAQRVADMHTMLSPVCMARKMDYLKIPMGEKDSPVPYIGAQTDQVPPKTPDGK